MIRKPFIGLVLTAFLTFCLDPLYADSFFSNLPPPGTIVHTSLSLNPVMLQGIRIDPKNPLHLDFILDTGDTAPNSQTIRAETLKLVRYFLASLTVPNDQLWVNLSPYEKNRIIPDGLALTEMGGELLAQDYMLKQLTASLLGPEQAAGRQFWSRIYAKAGAKYGSSPVPLDIFNKVWIVPDKATIYEHQGTAVVEYSHLKVMLEQDYLALVKNHHSSGNTGSMASDLIREVVLPQIEQEVNTGRNFAGVRQVNNALILAAWFKQNLKQTLLGQRYANRNKVSGIDLQDRTVKQKIYAQYLKAFKKGVYNYIKEDIDPRSRQIIARKYFLGGYDAQNLRLDVREGSFAQISGNINFDHALMASVDLAMMAPQGDIDKDAAQKRLREIKDHHYEGFPVVKQGQDIPVGVQYALAFYEKEIGPENSLKTMIREGRLRAGPDWEIQIKGLYDGDGILVSTDSENEVDQVLVELLSGKKEADKFREWKKEVRSKAIKPLAIFTSGVIAKPMEVLKRYGILDLLSSGKPVRMEDIVDHVRQLKIDGKKIRFNTPNAQYIAGVLRALASLGWLTMQGGSADSMEFVLTAQGAQALGFADRYAEVANFMPKFTQIADYLFNRENAPSLEKETLSLRQLDVLSKQGWGIPETLNPQLASLIKGQLNGYLVINLALALWQEKVFDLFDADLEININDIIRETKIAKDPVELKAAFDIFDNVGFLTDSGNGKYKLTQEGLVAFDRVLAYGVPVSYRPSYDLAEEFLFGDPKSIKRVDDQGRELLVYRYLNVLGSGASHATYFKQIDKIVQGMIRERLENKEIPPQDQLSAKTPFVLSFADIGSGDGTFLAHVYHVIMAQTRYGDLVRDLPDIYKIEMVGVDYNLESQFATSEKLRSEGIEHTVMFGNINDPKQIVVDVRNRLHEKYGKQAKAMVINTRTFLDHNRPWKPVENIEQAQKRVSQLTGTYGWRGEAIPKNFVEQNLYEHFKAWGDALKTEGQKDLIVIELHTIPPEVAAANIGKTLDIPYWLSHAFSDQFIIEFPIYKARVEEAGFVATFHRLFPDEPLTTVSVDVWHRKDLAMQARAIQADQSSPFGGINLNPDLGFVRIKRDGKGVELPIESGDLQNINIEGLEPVLLKIISLSGQRSHFLVNQ